VAKVPKINNLKEERLIVAHSFRPAVFVEGAIISPSYVFDILV
jgi:hypothetical protein